MAAQIDATAEIFTLINTCHTTPDRQAAIVAAALQTMLASKTARDHIAEVALLAELVEPVPYRVAFVSVA